MRIANEIGDHPGKANLGAVGRADSCPSRFRSSFFKQQPLRRDQSVTQVHQIPHFGPINTLTVEPQAKPAARAYVGRKIEALWLSRGAVDIFSQRRFAAPVNNAVAAMIFQTISEYIDTNSSIAVLIQIAQ